MKLYAIMAGPPSLSVKMGLKQLKVPHEMIEVNYASGEHLTGDYEKKNPQKEIPVIDDDGFFLSESNAILQYLCDKYAPDSNLYPKDPVIRAIVNHRLCFNLGTYYRHICEHEVEPIFFDVQRTPLGKKKVQLALETFNTYLQILGTKYSAANHLTIADLPLASATLCLECLNYDLTKYPLVNKWYETFKKENPSLLELMEADKQVMLECIKTPVDLSNYNHPINRPRKN